MRTQSPGAQQPRALSTSLLRNSLFAHQSLVCGGAVSFQSVLCPRMMDQREFPQLDPCLPASLGPDSSPSLPLSPGHTFSHSLPQPRAQPCHLGNMHPDYNSVMFLDLQGVTRGGCGLGSQAGLGQPLNSVTLTDSNHEQKALSSQGQGRLTC